jgi:hypothetical protein
MQLSDAIRQRRQLGGWTRAFVASLIGVAIAKFPGLSDILDPSTQNALGVAAASLVVGIWQHYAKSVAAPSTPQQGTTK